MHIVACNFIAISLSSDDSWITLLQLSSSFDIYIGALYWAICSCTHSPLGDIIPTTFYLQIYTCVIQCISCFGFSILLGSVASTLVISQSKLRNKLYKDYIYSHSFLLQKGIETKFERPITDYFNELWSKNKGISERDVLHPLPASLSAEILLTRYTPSLSKSEILNNNLGKNTALLHTIFRVIKIQVNLVGDIILHIDDLSTDMYIILDGEVAIINLEGTAILDFLKPGAHFGETNILLGTNIRTATVLATKISLFGLIGKKHLKMLLRAYPEWNDKLLSATNSRMLKTFKTCEISEINEICRNMYKMLEENPQMCRKYTKRSEQLIAHTVAEVLAKPTLDKWLMLSIMHVVLILYSCVSIPLEISARNVMSNWLIAMEMLCLCESLVYFSTVIKNSQLKNSTFTQIIKYLWKKQISLDLAALSPFNLVFASLGILTPSLIIIPLRSIRMLAIFRIHSIFSKLFTSEKELFLPIRITEILIYLVLGLHWVSCIIRFTYECNGAVEYLDSLYYALNLVSATGHTDFSPCSTNTRLFICAILIVSALAFAIVYGLFTYTFADSTPEIRQILDSVRIPFEKLLGQNLPLPLQHKLTAYIKFSAILTNTYGETVYQEIYRHLPLGIVQNLVYECSRHSLKKLPFLNSSDSEVLIKRIALRLKVKMYLPHDYLIYKDDLGDEMYFIDFGKVHIIAPDNSKVIKTLGDGDFFGEMALVNNSKRMCSVMASTLCLVHTLSKSGFNEILRGFPEVLQKIREQSEARTRETTSVTKQSGPALDEDEEQRKMFNHLSMYSLLSASYFSHSKKKTKFSVISGMQNIRNDTNFENFEKDKLQKMHKRRPHHSGPAERRQSQEVLGKELLKHRLEMLKLKWHKK